MDFSGYGRYSYIGFDPFMTFESKGKSIKITEGNAIRKFSRDPFDTLRDLMNIYNFEDSHNPEILKGAAVGYFSYDMGRLVENIPSHAADDLRVPDSILNFYDCIITIDRFENKIYLCGCNFSGRAKERIKEIKKEIRKFKPQQKECQDYKKDKPEGIKNRITPDIRSNFSLKGYKNAINRIKEYIAKGDVYQINLSQRFLMPLRKSPWSLYKNLRKINPAPFGAFLDSGKMMILSSSPERFLKYRASDRIIQTRPIKGTRPRGSDVKKNQEMINALLSSEKDHAEHLMIVDLERNDLGRVAETGSVNVKELAILETFPTVFHLTSTIEARMAERFDRIDLLKATFPGGSITGAPKIRAMEIIEELEPVRRGVYTGSIGYLSFGGDLNLNITIRTIVVKNQKAWFHAGGGIVIDSDPDEEYQETLDKAKALMVALHL